MASYLQIQLTLSEGFFEEGDNIKLKTDIASMLWMKFQNSLDIDGAAVVALSQDNRVQMDNFVSSFESFYNFSSEFLLTRIDDVTLEIAHPTEDYFQYSLIENNTSGKIVIQIANNGGDLNDQDPPTIPNNLTEDAKTDTTVDLSWDASTDTNPAATISYDVYRGVVKIANTSNISYQVTGLSPNTSYQFYIIANDGFGNFSPPSNLLDVQTEQTPDSEPPSKPLNLVSADITQNSANISWDASTDNVGVQNYDVYVNGSISITTVDTNYSIIGLLPSTTNPVYIVARDLNGNISEASDTLNIVTLDEVTPPLQTEQDAHSYVKPLLRSTRGDLDLKYRVKSSAQLEALFTLDWIERHHVIAVDTDSIPSMPRGRYELVTYPTYGSSTGTIWLPVGGSGGGGSMTPAQIKVAYESNPDTNAFTDFDKQNILFNSQFSPGLVIPNNWWLALVGIPISQLIGLTFSQIIENFFPTVLASIQTNKSFSISGGDSVTREVGSTVSQTINMTFNQGQINNGDGTVAGPVVGISNRATLQNPDLSTAEDLIDQGNSVTLNSTPQPILFGNNIWIITVTNEVGTTTYQDSKGGTDTIPSIETAKASITNSNQTVLVSGRYYRFSYIGNQNTSPTDSSGVRALVTKAFMSSINTETFQAFIPAGTQEFSFYCFIGKNIQVNDLGNINADITSEFNRTPISVNDAGGNASTYEKNTIFIGLSGYPADTTFNIIIS